eukprot:scaffold83966_cov37-Tisochrysis_lutea.AAC.2
MAHTESVPLSKERDLNNNASTATPCARQLAHLGVTGARMSDLRDRHAAPVSTNTTSYQRVSHSLRTLFCSSASSCSPPWYQSSRHSTVNRLISPCAAASRANTSKAVRTLYGLATVSWPPKNTSVSHGSSAGWI